MSSVPLSEIDGQRRLQARFRAGAKRDLIAWVGDQDVSNLDKFRGALAEFLVYLAGRWGDAAAAAAADWFEDRRLAEAGAGGPVFAAVLAGAVTEEAAAKAAAYASAPLAAADQVGEDVARAAVMRRAAQPLGRWVKDAGARTVFANAAADPARPRVVRVPRGDDTCAFCLMLASRGMVGDDPGYVSTYSAQFVIDPDRKRFSSDPRDPAKFHDDCDCEPVAFWGDEFPQGYDGERYAMLYETAVDDAGSRGDTSAILASMRKLHDLH